MHLSPISRANITLFLSFVTASSFSPKLNPKFNQWEKSRALNIAASSAGESLPSWQPFFPQISWQRVDYISQEEKIGVKVGGHTDPIPPAQQAHNLGLGLMKLRETFGWCLTEEECLELQTFQQKMEEKVRYMTVEERLRVKAAVEVAYHAHNGQWRKSGEPFIIHPVSVAEILSDLEMDCDTVIAGLLHDTVEDTRLAFDDVHEQFGSTVRKIVEGETKVSKLAGKVVDYNNKSRDCSSTYDKYVSNLRHMLIAMSEDWRIVVVKLADRLHNMQTISAMAPEKQKRIARETMDVFVPLAHRLGIWAIKCELEELCFPILDPQGHAKVQQLVKHRAVYTQQTDELLKEEKQKLENSLVNHPLLANSKEISNLRVHLGKKTLYNINRALIRNGISFFEDLDINLLCVIFEGSPKVGENHDLAQRDKALCYAVMEAVHNVLQPTSPPRIKDYIAFPKNNGYTSLQSSVFFKGYPVEVQIRTKWMDKVANNGIAAGWLGSENKGCSMQLPWLKEIQRCADLACFDQNNCYVSSSEAVSKSYPYAAKVKEELEDSALGRMFVFTNEEATINLSKESTVGDAARLILGKEGNRQRVLAAKVNSRLVGLNHKLRDGDVISIITTPARTDQHGSRKKLSRPIVLGNVRTQLVQSRGVWPWCLVGDESDEADRSAFRNKSEFEKREVSGDQMWYREAELKHGRMSIVALIAWLNAELIQLAGGRAVGAPAVAALAHQGPLAHLYSLTPLQVVQIIVAVGMLEGVYLTARQWSNAESLFLSSHQNSSSTSAKNLPENGGKVSGLKSRHEKESFVGRVAMVAVLALSLQGFLTGDDALGRVMGIF
mmetsp:Transcript_12050/g.18012  ORF Transcript_12050/g.18012 Transcript_12050/m.18012 type:complete len:835 (-) Transcript_12050:148-2652(-)